MFIKTSLFKQVTAHFWGKWESLTQNHVFEGVTIKGMMTTLHCTANEIGVN